MKKLVIPLIIVVLLGGSIAVWLGVSAYQKQQEEEQLSNTKINGEVVRDQAETQIRQKLETVQPTSLKIRDTVIDITEDITKHAEDFQVQKGADTQVSVTTEYNKDSIKQKIKAQAKTELGEFEKFDYKTILANITEGTTNDVSNGVILKYDQSVIDLYEKCCKWTAEYKANDTGGRVESAVSLKANKNYVSIKKNKVVFDDSFINKFMRKLEHEWDDLGRSMKIELFSSSKKPKLGGTWGTLMDSAKERAYLVKQFHKGKRITDREPYLKVDHRGKIGNTRIEVSISNQTLWYYKKGKLKKTTSVVTGKTGHSTPKGIYFMSERVPGKYLVGPDYKTWVNRWMRLTDQGVGLHDANWRSNFGGSIYVNSGSHGCVNLPSSFAYWLYPKTYYGMPVIVY